jgi:WD40 repeat protein
VLALAVSPSSGLLFSGGLDATIGVWELNAASGTFALRATLSKDSGGGHRAAVHALLVAGQFLFSGDRAGEVKVWSLADGSCVQTIERAHEGPIMRMLVWGEVRGAGGPGRAREASPPVAGGQVQQRRLAHGLLEQPSPQSTQQAPPPRAPQPPCPSPLPPAPLPPALPQNYLLTAAMDGTIRCWSPGQGTILAPEPEFTFSGAEEDSSGGAGPRHSRRVRSRGRQPAGTAASGRDVPPRAHPHTAAAPAAPS